MEIDKLWNSEEAKKEGVKNPPEIFLLFAGNRYFAVTDDSSSIIFVASKAKNIYAVAKSKVSKTFNNENIPIYQVSNIDSLKVISCTIGKIKDPNQLYAIKKIVQFL